MVLFDPCNTMHLVGKDLFAVVGLAYLGAWFGALDMYTLLLR